MNPEVAEFMKDQIVDAWYRKPNKQRVQNNRAILSATAPPCFHLARTHTGERYALMFDAIVTRFQSPLEYV